MQVVVFRPRRVTWGFFALLVLPFAVGGCIGLALTGEPVFGCWIVVGWMALALLSLKARTRVVVDEAGVAKRSLSGGAFRAPWGDIEGWSVIELRPNDEEADAVTRRLVRLQIRGARWPERVTDSEAERPPFEEFVRLLRERIPEREIAEPVAQLDHHPPGRPP